jgi:hypothetical protein
MSSHGPDRIPELNSELVHIAVLSEIFEEASTTLLTEPYAQFSISCFSRCNKCGLHSGMATKKIHHHLNGSDPELFVHKHRTMYREEPTTSKPYSRNSRPSHTRLFSVCSVAGKWVLQLQKKKPVYQEITAQKENKAPPSRVFSFSTVKNISLTAILNQKYSSSSEWLRPGYSSPYKITGSYTDYSVVQSCSCLLSCLRSWSSILSKIWL